MVRLISYYSRPLSFVGRLGLGFLGQRGGWGNLGQDSGIKFWE